MADLDPKRWTPSGIGISIGVTVVGGVILLVLGKWLFPATGGQPGRTDPPPPPTTSSTSATPTSSPSTPSTAAPAPAASTLPYKADWAGGLGGWVGSNDWTVVRGQLVNNGMSQGTAASITAPVRINVGTDYAVEAQIALVRNSDAGMISGMASFGVVVRSDSAGDGYGAGRCVASGFFSCSGPAQSSAVLWTSGNASVLDAAAFDPGRDVHRYRIEVRGNQLAVLIDGAPVLSAVDNAFPNEGRVGLWSDRAQITVLGFEVAAI